VVGRWERGEEPMQPSSGYIGDHHIAELGELRCDGVGNRDLLERMREEVAQELSKYWGESIVKTGSGKLLVSGSLVDALERSDRAGFAVHGEAQDKRPDEHRDVDLPLALDGIALPRDTFDELWGKERNQPATNEVWGEFRVHILSLRGLRR